MLKELVLTSDQVQDILNKIDLVQANVGFGYVIYDWNLHLVPDTFARIVFVKLDVETKREQEG